VSVLSDLVQGATSGVTDAPAKLANTVLSIGQELIDRIWPDKEKQARERAEAEQHLLDIHLKRQADILAAVGAVDAAQSNVNAIEAGSASLLKSGWRPAIGWVCAGALALNYWPRAIAGVTLWVIQCVHAGQLVAYPDLGVADLLGLVGSLLGMSTLRHLEVQQGKR